MVASSRRRRDTAGGEPARLAADPPPDCPPDAKISKEIQCGICMETVTKYTKVHNCSHRYCRPCMQKHVEYKLLHHSAPPRCPHVGCTTVLRPTYFKKVIPANHRNIMKERMKESAIACDDRVYCPNPSCSALMSKLALTRSNPNSTRGRCVECEELFCFDCLCSYPIDGTAHKCKKKKYMYMSSELKKLAKKKHWRRCTKCHHMIELRLGCYHVTCRCGFEFCYKCGASRFSKNVAGCSCLSWDEQNIIYNNRVRRG